MKTTRDRDVSELAALAALMDTLRTVSSLKMKETILRKSIKRNPFIIKYLRATYNPFVQYRLTSKRARKSLPNGMGEWEGILRMLAQFSKESGNELKAMNWRAHMRKLAKPLRKAANCVLDKDWKCRLGVKTVNKVLARLGKKPIPEYSVALGKPYTGQDVFDGSWLLSRKYDGIRATIVVSESGRPRLFSRQGKEFLQFDELADTFYDYRGPDAVFDGEIALIREGGADDFKGLMRLLQRKDIQIKGACFHAFDLISMEEFEARKGKTPLSERLKKLDWQVDFLHSKFLKMAKQIKCTPEALDRLMTRCRKKKWEGLIARKDAPYLGKRSGDILKIKKMKDLEAKVVSIETGTMSIVEDGRERVVKVMTRANIKYKGNIVGVGSGWSVKQRRRFYKHPKEIIGKVITVQYKKATQDKHGNKSLQFPVVKCTHGADRTT